ncbi:hypothetical protein [Candidatus Ruthturnera calyptogenae]|uniref:hypothetical protein n=1 Tax=Candidatus Ruthturnera calyptogenae TaxID=386487 RepID=UPI0004640087|nr:hypothetical protein [Candidatus Ruthturnera calyptogenae]
MTDDDKLQHKISNQKFDKEKTYIMQVDDNITNANINSLMLDIVLKDAKIKSSKAKITKQLS